MKHKIYRMSKMRDDTEKDKKPSKSTRLRKYGSVYKKHVKKKSTPVRIPRSRNNKTKNEEDKPKQKHKKLNDYQKFVKKESRKDKYSNMRGSERLNAIATEWETYKKKISKKETKIQKKTY